MIPVKRVHHGDGGFEILRIDYGLRGLSHFSTARRGTFVCNLLYTVGRRASGGGGGGGVVVGCTRLGHRAHARTHVLDMLLYYNIMSKVYLFIFNFLEGVRMGGSRVLRRISRFKSLLQT